MMAVASAAACGGARSVIVRLRESSCVRVMPVTSRTTRSISVASSGVLEAGKTIVRMTDAS